MKRKIEAIGINLTGNFSPLPSSRAKIFRRDIRRF